MAIAKFSLNTSVEKLGGLIAKFSPRLKNLNILTVKNLLWHFPFRYDDFSNLVKVAELKPDEKATICGVIKDVKFLRTWKKKMFLLEAKVADETGEVKAIWFNQKFLINILRKGTLVNLAGKVQAEGKGKLYFSHPMYEVVNKKAAQRMTKEDIEQVITDLDYFKHTGRLVPVYPETAKLTSKAIRYIIKIVLDNVEKIEEILPAEVLEKNSLLEINEALKKIHFPDNLEEAKLARKRFTFEDLFYLQLSNIRQRQKLAGQKAYSLTGGKEYAKKLVSGLPFELTVAQEKSLAEVLADLEKGRPMNRLLQGDVGSGKTIVAVIAALLAAENGKQAVFMAPTEVLARQHYQTFQKFFGGFEKGVALLVSSEAKAFYGGGMETVLKKSELLKQISFGEIKIIIGTHAVIQKSVQFNELALAVIDEQHRFGVNQRAELVSRKLSGENKILPHFLSMSATPIPRTLSLTLFSDLDLSIIDELPKDRKEIITKIVPPENRDKVYAFIRGLVKKGRQVFVVCPRIEQPEEEKMEKKVISKSLFNPWEDVKAVKDEYDKLAREIFPDLKVGLLHGKMKAKEKAEAMRKFKERETDILVSTSVIEVGVDVPNATIMMIEGADRFGLAQLYQFRGRVGRGEHQSFCLLFTDSGSQMTRARLQSLIDAKSGFELAEKDLEIRGPGEFLGQSQTGLPDLAMKALKSPAMVKDARSAAEDILNKDPELKNYPRLKEFLEQFEKEVHLE